ncbi:hypothetical protein [Novosphingobium rosa]|uniref:hypothetical protein n=1 Tax=Novosphingobium rosa TaxID=76978 RepID=UPI000B1C189A|nr:hypothetical protein [Novosphingobium rosa]
MATMLETIRWLVERLSPSPVCAACVGRHLNLPIDDALHADLGELTVERDFASQRDACGLCGGHGPVILKQRRQNAA